MDHAVLSGAARTLRQQADKLIELAEVVEGPSRSRSAQATCSTAYLKCVAQAHYRRRRARKLMLDKLDLGQTAWDMLVVLFIEQLDRKEISITSLCYASLSPTTTALRWLTQLEQRGMVIRKQSPDDLRVQFAELTDKGEQLVREHFSEFGNL